MLKFDVKIPTRRSKNFFLGFEGRNFNNFFRILRTLGFFSYLVKRSHFVSPTAWYSHLAMLGNFKFGLGPLKLSLNSRYENLWFFDSHHIALKLNMSSNIYIIDDTRNGVHITHRAKREIWRVFCRCVNGRLNDGDDISNVWPLREAFRRFASRARR